MDRPQDGGSTTEVTVMASDAAGRTLHCVVERPLRIQGRDYGLLSPVDTPVYLFRWPDDSAAEPELITDPHRYSPVLDQLDMALRNEDLFLVRSAGLLTVAGDPSNIADDTGDDDDAEDDTDSYFALATACYEGIDFALYGSLEPCFLVARLGQGAAELLEPDVLAGLQPLIEEALADDGEECS